MLTAGGAGFDAAISSSMGGTGCLARAWHAAGVVTSPARGGPVSSGAISSTPGDHVRELGRRYVHPFGGPGTRLKGGSIFAPCYLKQGQAPQGGRGLGKRIRVTERLVLGGSGFEGCCLLSRQLFEGSIGYFLYYSPGDPPLEGSTVRHDPIPYGPYSESQRRLPRDVDLLISDVDLHRRHGQSPHLG